MIRQRDSELHPFLGRLSRAGRIAATAAVALAVARTSAAQYSVTESKPLGVRVDIFTEYDTNVTLGSDVIDDAAGGGDREAVRDDLVLRVQPELTFRREHERHLFSLDLSGDFRRGLINTNLADTNFAASGLIELNSTGGLQIQVYDDFNLVDFDQALFFEAEDPNVSEAGVTKVRANTLGFNGAYRPGERFELTGSYAYDFENYKFSLGEDDDRQVHRGRAGLTVPLGDAVAVYGRGHYLDQNAPDRPRTEYDDARVVGGMRWFGRNRFQIWGEGGIQKIDFTNTEPTDFDEIVFQGGVDVDVSEETFVRAAAGRDGYGQFVYNAVFQHFVAEGSRTRIVANKTTQNSFSRQTISRLFRHWTLTGRWDKPLARRWTIRAHGGFFRLQADNSIFNVEQNEKTYVASARIEHRLREWLTLGGGYRYARRNSNIAVHEFVDNRFGGYLALVY